MKVVRIFFNTILPLAILAIGFMVMKNMISSRPAPRKEAREHPGLLVKYLTARRSTEPLIIRGTGTVQHSREAAVTPQVSGRIAAISPHFVAGGFFSAGELMFEIERADYELALESAKAARARAELELARQKSNAMVARSEWERLDIAEQDEPNPLVLYEPQLKQARAALASADTAIRKAELDLARTRMTAPFNCRVRSEDVELGQFVRAGVSVGRVAGTDRAEIVVPLPLAEAGLLAIPRTGSSVKGSPVTVELAAGDDTYRWTGRVVRSLGDVDPRGRLMRVVAAVDDPFQLTAARHGDRPDLAFGLFVNVTAEAGHLDGVFRIPRLALRDGESVWTVGEDNTLAFRKVLVVRREENHVLVGGGLHDGDRVIVTHIEGAAPGMKLRTSAVGSRP